jgi:mono/diheme cytochrome c family protein
MPGTKMMRVAGTGALALALVAGWSGGPRAADLGEGNELHLKYCSACHGENGKGDGVVSHPFVADRPMARSGAATCTSRAATGCARA